MFGNVLSVYFCFVFENVVLRQIYDNLYFLYNLLCLNLL